MKDRLRVFVEARNPGSENDPETKRFQDGIKREAEDLKLESFGIEVSASAVATLHVAHVLSALAHHRRCLHDQGSEPHQESQELLRTQRLLWTR